MAGMLTLHLASAHPTQAFSSLANHLLMYRRSLVVLLPASLLEAGTPEKMCNPNPFTVDSRAETFIHEQMS